MSKHNALVTQDNRLIQAQYSLSVDEKKLLALAMSKIDSRQFPDNVGNSRDIVLTASDWEERFHDTTNAYQSLTRATSAMFDRQVAMKLEDGRILTTRWISSIMQDSGEREITIEIPWPMRVLLEGLQDKFTSYRISEISRFSTFYTIRLFELLMKEKSRGALLVSVEDLRKVFSCEKKYKSIFEFQRRVIQPAVEEINEKSGGWEIDYTAVKKGVKITSFRFSIKQLSQRDLFKGEQVALELDN